MRDQYFGSGTYGRLRMGMALRGPCFTSAERNTEDKRDGKLADDNAGHALELMHAAREHLRA